jgi:hypothetical protein
MSVVVPDLPEIFEEAFERAGLEMKSGYDLRTIRRSFNLLTLEWQNRGLNLWTIEAGTLPLVVGQAVYTLPVNTIDLIEHQLRSGTGTNQLDTALERISVSTYAQQANKNLRGRPTQIFVQRLANSVTVTLWPVPNSQFTLAYYRLRGTSGLQSGIEGTPDIPPRFIPALVAGLAFHIAMKRPEAAERAIALKQAYEEAFALAADADQERASLYITPGAW